MFVRISLVLGLLMIAQNSDALVNRGCYARSNYVYQFASLTMTQGQCITSCNTLNFLYAVLTTGLTCMCTDKLPTALKQPDSACTVPCGGNAAETCGGDELFTILQLGFTYVSCGTAPGYRYRDLLPSATMTNELCYEFCKNDTYALLVNTYCFCTIMPTNDKTAADCVGGCPGNSSQTCSYYAYASFKVRM